MGFMVCLELDIVNCNRHLHSAFELRILELFCLYKIHSCKGAARRRTAKISSESTEGALVCFHCTLRQTSLTGRRLLKMWRLTVT